MNTLIRWFAGLVLVLPLAAGAVVSRPATPFTDAEIDQLLAPIALYPDTVLSHVLIAATVPDDVEEAAEWSRRHPDLRGQAAVTAVEGRDWDPSVKALAAFPEVLERMDDDPEWTEDLGEAFLEQEATVMDRVQYLRDRADAEGSLESVEHVRVVREREYIYLEPAVSHVVYVPYYDPWIVYGSWWWPYYPPHRWAYWGGYPYNHYYGSTFYWGVGFNLGPSYYYGGFNWRDRHVVTTRPHRNYHPSPGYSGHSDVRRPRNETAGDRHGGRQDSRTPHDSRRPEWRHDNRRADGRHDNRRTDNRRTDPPRRDDPPRRNDPPRRDDPPGHDTASRGPGHRRSWSEVRDELSARRESRPSGDSRSWSDRSGSGRAAPRVSSRPSGSHGLGEVRRESRGPSRGDSDRPERSGHGRVERAERPQYVERPQQIERPQREVQGNRRAPEGGGAQGKGGDAREYRQGWERRQEVQRQGRGVGRGRQER